MRYIRRRFRATDDFRGTKLFVIENGKRLMTPMFVVIVALGSTDLLFALDSIPAIYGLTQEPYLVFTANVFALMGLRQLYFLVGGMLKRLVYLSLGLSVILGFIGIKLVLHAMHEYHWADWAPFDGEIPIWLSLGVIVGTLTITTLASLAKSKRDDATRTAPEAI
jgi:tellurite resistance protein TerC